MEVEIPEVFHPHFRTGSGRSGDSWGSSTPEADPLSRLAGPLASHPRRLLRRRLRSSSTRRRPSSTERTTRFGRRATRVDRCRRSRVRTWDTLATESRGSRRSRHWSRTFPGASANRRSDVIATTMTVAMRLRSKASPWTTRTGRRNPRSDLEDHRVLPTRSRRAGSPVFPRDGTSLQRVEARVEIAGGFVGFVRAIETDAVAASLSHLTDTTPPAPTRTHRRRPGRSARRR